MVHPQQPVLIGSQHPVQYIQPNSNIQVNNNVQMHPQLQVNPSMQVNQNLPRQVLVQPPNQVRYVQ